MDRFDNMRVFAKVVENSSFAGAAARLDISASMVTLHVKELDARLRSLRRIYKIIVPLSLVAFVAMSGCGPHRTAANADPASTSAAVTAANGVSGLAALPPSTATPVPN